MFDFIGRQSSLAHFRVFKDIYSSRPEERRELLEHVALLLRSLSHAANVGREEFIAELDSKVGSANLLEAYLVNLEARIPKSHAKSLNVKLLNDGARSKKTMGETNMFYANNFNAAYMQMIGQTPSAIDMLSKSSRSRRSSHALLKKIRSYIVEIFQDNREYILTDTLVDNLNDRMKDAGLV